jgi:tRNA-specific 2-thiouridylase
VIDSFAESYVAGETPIPCVTCNQEIKFRDLLDRAPSSAPMRWRPATTSSAYRRGWPASSIRPADSRSRSELLPVRHDAQPARAAALPLGGYRKSEVRALARDSVCRRRQGRQPGHLLRSTGPLHRHHRALKPGAVEPGEIVHVDGRVLGRHEGIIRYTVGQRRGLGIATGEPLYVVRLEAATSRVVVGPREALKTNRLQLRDVNWLGDETLRPTASKPIELWARVRSSQPPRPARLDVAPDGGISVELVDGEHGVAAGQACVFYVDGSAHARILGGGFIRQVESGLGSGPVPDALALSGDTGTR